ncbi:MAG: Gfo/Idh/MocA family oxidoreductase [Trueperaceae bacterium]|nr:Gfo/Idh/MocA family oxidoreductase [Trueperaceae bacterium]
MTQRDDGDTDRDAPVRWGILGAANIARKAVGPAIVASGNGVVAAVASRERPKAEAFARELDAARAHEGYQALLEDGDVEAVYVPLPNALHEEWSIRALEAGKHVLCEKPLAPTAAACLRMKYAAEAAERHLMEAFMYRFHPRTRAATRRLHGGVVGALRQSSATFTFRLRDRGNVRYSKDLAGGALLDVGCYTVDASRRLMGEEPIRAVAMSSWTDSGVDAETVGMLAFPSGATASISCALTLPRVEKMRVQGEEGTLRLPRAFLPGIDPVEIQVDAADGASDAERVSGVDQYRLMVEAFAARVQGRDVDAPASDAEEAARTLRVLDALAASAQGGGRPVEVAAASASV